MTIDDIKMLVSLVLGKKYVQAEDRLIEDLGAESVDIVSLIASVEDSYGVVIDEGDIGQIRTVNDLYQYVVDKI